jgi:hypothetical protein
MEYESVFLDVLSPDNMARRRAETQIEAMRSTPDAMVQMVSQVREPSIGDSAEHRSA